MSNEIETTLDRKKHFALELLRNPNDPFKAAIEVFPENAGMALMVTSRWPNDPEVKKYQAEAMATLGETGFLPSKGDLARAVWTMAENEKYNADERLRAYRLFGDIQGHIEKGAGPIINNNLTSNKVMVVNSQGSDDEWEHRAASQQARLVEEAYAPRPTE